MNAPMMWPLRVGRRSTCPTRRATDRAARRSLPDSQEDSGNKAALRRRLTERPISDVRRVFACSVTSEKRERLRVRERENREVIRRQGPPSRWDTTSRVSGVTGAAASGRAAGLLVVAPHLLPLRVDVIPHLTVVVGDGDVQE